METALALQRTPDVIALEINNIKEQTRMLLLCNSIEIGRRLVEVKSMLPHGEWGNWLESSVDYSQSTANNLMRIFDEYGALQLSLFGSEVKSQALGKLGYTQAVALLGIPAEEREQFIEEHDVENMSTRELQQVIKERDKALTDLMTAHEAVEKQSIEAQRIKADLEQEQETAKKAQDQLKQVEAQLADSTQQVAELEQLLKEKPIDVPATEIVEKIPEGVERELSELRQKSTAAATANEVAKFTVYFNELVRGFNDLLSSLTEIQQVDQEAYTKYRKAVTGLIDKMAERL